MNANLGLFTHLHFADPLIDQGFTHVGRAVLIHVVIDKLQVVELQRVRGRLGGGVGQDLIGFTFLPRQLLRVFRQYPVNEQFGVIEVTRAFQDADTADFITGTFAR